MVEFALAAVAAVTGGGGILPKVTGLVFSDSKSSSESVSAVIARHFWADCSPRNLERASFSAMAALR